MPNVERGERSQGAHVLLTGATGFLGKVVLYELLRRRKELGVERISLLVRPKRRGDALARFRSEILSSPCFRDIEENAWRLVECIPGDIQKIGAGVGDADRRKLLDGVTHVVHCAASVEFHLPIAKATAANATGSLNVLKLAGGCRRLVRMVDVSTAYVTPHPGEGVRVRELFSPLPCDPTILYADIVSGRYDTPDAQRALLSRTSHPNTYTFTKCLSEHLLTRARGALPLSIVRPSIITASQERPFEAWIDSPAAFALFTMAIGTGRMRALIGRPDAKLDIVPVDHVSDQILSSAFETPASRPLEVVHAVAGLDRSPRIDFCIERLTRFFSENPPPAAEGAPIGIRYVGPDGPRYRLWHWREHRLRARIRPMADQLAKTTRRFAYFTENTFDFESSASVTRPQMDPAKYVDAICRGVYTHLLRAGEPPSPDQRAAAARDPSALATGWRSGAGLSLAAARAWSLRAITMKREGTR